MVIEKSYIDMFKERDATILSQANKIAELKSKLAGSKYTVDLFCVKYKEIEKERDAKIEALKELLKLAHESLDSKDKQIAEFVIERDVLNKFVSWSLDAVFAGSGICGDAAQDKMFELGILTREIYDPEIHYLAQGSECDAGDYIYFKALKEQHND